MTKIKMCGMMSREDILAANEILPDAVGFVFLPGRRRYLTPGKAAQLRELLSPGIQAVGVFIDEPPETVAELLRAGIIDMAQLHGTEGETYLRRLREMTDKPLMQAIPVHGQKDLTKAEKSSADLILLDSGTGTGRTFDWTLLQGWGERGRARPYFLAGGLSPENVGEAIRFLHPFGVDVSSGIETDGRKDRDKMAAFAAAVRKEDAI